MRNQDFNSSKFTVIEVENLYEKYTGHRYGYKFKAEYQFKKTQSEAVYHRVSIVCREIMPNSPQVNVEVTTSCAPHGIFEKINFIVKDEMTKGSSEFCESITREAFKRADVLSNSFKYEKEQKDKQE